MSYIGFGATHKILLGGNNIYNLIGGLNKNVLGGNNMSTISGDMNYLKKIGGSHYIPNLGTNNITEIKGIKGYGLIPTISVGDDGPAGGYVGYVDTNNTYDWSFIEVAPSSYWGDEYWGDNGTVTTDSNPRTHTENLYNNFNSQAAGHCLDISYTYEGTTYSDWCLPYSSFLGFILNAMYPNSLGNFDSSSSYIFWSSSASGTLNAFATSCWGGSYVGNDAWSRSSYSHGVLPVRFVY